MLGKRLAVGVTLQRRNHAFPHEENASEPVLDALEFDGHLAPGHVRWISSWSARWNDEVHEETHARQVHRAYLGLGVLLPEQGALGTLAGKDQRHHLRTELEKRTWRLVARERLRPTAARDHGAIVELIAFDVERLPRSLPRLRPNRRRPRLKTLQNVNRVACRTGTLRASGASTTAKWRPPFGRDTVPRRAGGPLFLRSRLLGSRWRFLGTKKRSPVLQDGASGAEMTPVRAEEAPPWRFMAPFGALGFALALRKRHF